MFVGKHKVHPGAVREGSRVAKVSEFCGYFVHFCKKTQSAPGCGMAGLKGKGLVSHSGILCAE